MSRYDCVRQRLGKTEAQEENRVWFIAVACGFHFNLVPQRGGPNVVSESFFFEIVMVESCR